jgi:hypothetical protein
MDHHPTMPLPLANPTVGREGIKRSSTPGAPEGRHPPSTPKKNQASVQVTVKCKTAVGTVKYSGLLRQASVDFISQKILARYVVRGDR